MRAILTGLVACGVMIAIFIHYGGDVSQINQLPMLKSLKETTAEKAAETDSAAGDKWGTDWPLGRWMQGSGAGAAADQPRVPGKPHALDHIAPSPVGTSGVVLRRTFAVTRAASYSFAIPAHAATPKLRGNFHSFAADASNDAADIAFLLLNEEQYQGFLQGRLGDALLAVESSHNQEISCGLPASSTQPVIYYLVFENKPGEGKKTVQADFKVEF
jgi:hypothetical protein